MFAVGLAGQPRRVSVFDEMFNRGNQITSAGAFVIMAGMLVFLAGVIHSWKHGQQAPMNPWHAKTIEWTVPNPVPLENFETLPEVHDDPYTFGTRKESV